MQSIQRDYPNNNRAAARQFANPQIEMQVLSAMLQDDEALEYCLSALSPDDYHDPRNQAIYRAMQELHSRGVACELTLIAEEVMRDLPSFDGFYVGEVAQAAITAVYHRDHANKLKELTTKRKQIEALQRATAAAIAGESIDGYLGDIVQPQPQQKTKQWPQIDEAAYYGLAGDFVRMIEPTTEADPVALLVQFLTCFGNAIGRNPHFRVGATNHHFNLFSVLVGQSSRGRKGTSLDFVLRLFDSIDPEWRAQCVKSGLVSGEGVKHAVRDARHKDDTIIDEGVSDKRLLAVESEFASVIRVTAREGNTLSAVIRQAWDDGNLRNMSKGDPTTATGAHISIVGHITIEELIHYLRQTEAVNGFGNRFLWVCTKRSKILSRSGSVSDNDIDSMAQQIRYMYSYATGVTEPIDMTPEAWELWDTVYPHLTRDVSGMLGAIISRGEAQVRRLACLYALMDHRDIVDIDHLQSALALWNYVEESAEYIFGGMLGDRTADTILNHLKDNRNGLTRTEIYDLFQRHKSRDEITRSLDLLTANGSVKKQKIKTSGRPTERWIAQ